MTDITSAAFLTGIVAFLPMLLKAALILIVCLIVSRILLAASGKLLNKSKLDKSLHAIIRSTLKVLLVFLTILIVAPSLGIETASLLAVLSIAGVAVSLSIQGILGNFFSGVTLLATKPFKVGDFVTIGGQTGTIVETGITHTKINTVDNQVILVPNSTVTSDVITNVSAEAVRRVDLTFTAAYESDPETVMAALREAAAMPQVLRDRENLVRIGKYGDSSVVYEVRVWVNNADYWDVYYGITGRVLPCYEKHGVTMSYPHLNIHTVQ